MIHITGTHFNYYFVCHRKLWLFHRGIHMEQNSDKVYEGKLIHETSYAGRSKQYREIETGGIKIDYFDTKTNTIHEIKKSDKLEEAHRWQLRYYIFVLQELGIKQVKGILEYPSLKKREELALEEEHVAEIKKILSDIRMIVQQEDAPKRISTKTRCKACAYNDFCWSD